MSQQPQSMRGEMTLIPTKVADEITELPNTSWHSVGSWLNLITRSAGPKQGLRSLSFRVLVCIEESSYIQYWLNKWELRAVVQDPRTVGPCLVQFSRETSSKAARKSEQPFTQTLYSSDTTCTAKLLCFQTAPAAEMPQKMNLIFADHPRHCTGQAHHQLSHADVFTWWM